MDDQSPSMLKPTLIGGGVCGVVGAIPIVGGLLTCACCSPLVGAGFLAAYFYSKESAGQGSAFRPGAGALVGLVSALFYAISNTVVWRMFFALFPQDVDETIEQLDSQGVPPEFVDAMANVLEMLGGFFGIFIYFFVVLLMGAVFCTIGGLIGGAVFKVEPAAPAPPLDVTPPPSSGDGGSV
jgi:hypothetical protein